LRSRFKSTWIVALRWTCRRILKRSDGHRATELDGTGDLEVNQKSFSYEVIGCDDIVADFTGQSFHRAPALAVRGLVLEISKVATAFPGSVLAEEQAVIRAVVGDWVRRLPAPRILFNCFSKMGAAKVRHAKCSNGWVVINANYPFPDLSQIELVKSAAT
jgi:hypothetical protein